MAQKPVNNIPYQIVDEKPLFTGSWLGVKQIDFVHKKTNRKRIRQIAYRTIAPQGALVDGVSVIAILKKKNEKYFVLVKQYRLPVMAYSLEFPAGLVDPKETSREAALRELLEETGFSATKILRCTEGVQTLNPSLCKDSGNFVVVEIDGDTDGNENPVQKLHGSEEIEVVLVPCDKALETLDLLTKEGVYVEAMVYSFVLGYVLAKGNL